MKKCKAFSLVELIIVVVIIGIIAAIAVPRMSNSAERAGDSAESANVGQLEQAIEMYKIDHDNVLPGAATIADQLTKCTDIIGNVKSGTAAEVITRDNTYAYGPYLKSIPPAPAGDFKGKTDIKTAAAKDTNTGWIYDDATGGITMNE